MQYISRAEWGAQLPRGPLPAWRPDQPTGIAIHYVGGAGFLGDADHAQCLARLRNLQAWAMSGHYTWTYADIEYNLAACHHGAVFEARGIDVQGAAQMNANADHASVLALANVDDVITGTPLADAVNAAVQVIQAHYPRATEIVGHRDTAGNPTGTNCPGDTIEAWIHAGRPGVHPQGVLMALSDVQQQQLFDAVIATEKNLLQGEGRSLINDIIDALYNPKAEHPTILTNLDARLKAIEQHLGITGA